MSIYKGLVITSRGAENISSIEIDELIKGDNYKKEDTVVKFEFSDLLELCEVCYKAQSINKALLLLSEFKIEKSLESTAKKIKDSLEKIELNDWVSKEKSIKVECERYGEHDFRSVDIEIETGKILCNFIENKYKIKQKTDFDNPDIIFFLYIMNNKGYLGIDFAGIELSKRQYKIFNHPESLKGTTGYILARESGFNGKVALLDPFMGSGVIIIEAGLYALNFPVQYYNKDKLAFTNFGFFKKYGYEKFFKKQDSKIKDKKTKIYGYDLHMRYLKATQKNAKLAGIDKYINMSRCEIEWLDTKFDKEKIDIIVTDPPRISKNRPDKNINKIYGELFYQANYVLKKKGLVVVFAKDNEFLSSAAKKHKFKIKETHTLNQGKEIFNVITYEREEK